MSTNESAAAIVDLTAAELSEIKALILERLNIVKPEAKLDAEHEIDVFVNNWKLLASQQKGFYNFHNPPPPAVCPKHSGLYGVLKFSPSTQCSQQDGYME